MKNNQIPSSGNPIARMHPLIAVAAGSVILVSLLAAAALTGVLPSSHANGSDEQYASEPINDQKSSGASSAQKAQNHRVAAQHASNQAAPASTDNTRPPVVQNQTQPAAPKQNSAVGIGIGAVVGGLLGNQVGSGDGKTLATIAGAVGGGYVGNEIAKKNQ